ncbi:hypothetical protein D6C97_09193 [Aureobasidium pullulans]|nr:hypothetical protein D6C97_09193 [Aureobasidium pullulans]
MKEIDDLNRSKAINIINDRGDTHDTSGHSETPVSNASLAGGSPSLIDRTSSRAVSQGKNAPSEPSVSTKFSSVAPSVCDARGNHTSSAISFEKRNSGVPGLGRTILFRSRQSPISTGGINAGMPSKRRRLASPHRPGLRFNFGLDTNALPPLTVMRDRSAPRGPRGFSRDVTLHKQEIAKAAQIEFSALSDETKAIMGYAIEKPAVDRTLASISELRLYSEGGISRAITATAAGPTVEAGAYEAPDAKPTPMATVMTAKELTARKRHDELQEEKRVQHNHSAQIAAGSRGKHLAEALDESEEGDLQASGDDGGYVARVDPSPASETRGTAPPTKRVNFLTLETLVDHTSKYLERYNNKRISGLMLSISFTLIYASFSSSPANPAKLLSTLKDFKRLLSLLLEKLRRFLRTAQASEGAAKKAALIREQVVLAKKDMEFLERCV